ncbi:MAG TPA: FtsX-like permease family protein [Candidatus Angelobacter sp.]|jgi:putative ABC transport system permease protein|nr:FtsX-like permease family protein [Candidatus Angelobacter sp.]
MTRAQLLLRLLLKAAWVRKDRAFTALVSVAVVATIATAALTIYSDLEGKLSREFRGFGANVIVTKASGNLTGEELAGINKIVGVRGEVVPVGYAIATEATSKSRIVVGGADVAKLRELNASWSFSNTGQGTALVGARVDETITHGSDLQLSFGKAAAVIKPAGFFHSGSDDDSRVYIPLEDFVRLTGIQPNTALVRVEGKPQQIQNVVSQLSAGLPGVEVKPVRQITQAQTAVVGKTRSVVLASSAAVVVLIMLCMVATFTGSVLERRKDFAVMKALGASNRTVNFLFASEAALLALAGSVAGYVLGCVIAFWIGKANFDAAILPQPMLLFPVLLGSVVLALIASTAPLRLLQQIQPAGILRGE